MLAASGTAAEFEQITLLETWGGMRVDHDCCLAAACRLTRAIINLKGGYSLYPSVKLLNATRASARPDRPLVVSLDDYSDLLLGVGELVQVKARNSVLISNDGRHARTVLLRTDLFLALQADINDCVPDQRGVLSAIHFDGVEACMARLPGDGGSVGTVAAALSDEAGA